MTGLLAKLKCLFLAHEYKNDRAVEWAEGGYTRYHRDGSKEPIPGCVIIEKCARCGAEERLHAPADYVENHLTIPTAWEEGSK